MNLLESTKFYFQVRGLSEGLLTSRLHWKILRLHVFFWDSVHFRIYATLCICDSIATPWDSMRLHAPREVPWSWQVLNFQALTSFKKYIICILHAFFSNSFHLRLHDFFWDSMRLHSFFCDSSFSRYFQIILSI